MFVLDSNILIEAHKRYYGLDLCPGFWECLRVARACGEMMQWTLDRRGGRGLTSNELVPRIVRSIVEAVDPEQVILFGSRARGDFRQDSDVDLVVIEAEPFGADRSRHQEMVRLLAVVSEFDVEVDVLVFSLDDVEYWKDSINHVLARALREGKVVHERP